MTTRLELQVEGRTFVPGDTITAILLVVEGDSSRSLEAWLEFHEATDDYGSVVTSISSGPLHEGDLVTGMTFELAFTVPADALPSYRSEHGHLYWEVHARSDRPGRDVHQSQRILVTSGRSIPTGTDDSGVDPTS